MEIKQSIIMKKIFVYLFWIYYVHRFQKRDPDYKEILGELRLALREKSLKLFILIQPPKEEILEILPFYLSVAVRIAYAKHFAKAKSIMDEIDLHYMIHEELLGFFPSDVYLDRCVGKYIKPIESNQSNIDQFSTPPEGSKRSRSNDAMAKFKKDFKSTFKGENDKGFRNKNKLPAVKSSRMRDTQLPPEIAAKLKKVKNLRSELEIKR